MWALKHSIACDNSRHVYSRHIYLHCGIEETGSPGIICIMCHQVICHPSEHGTSSMEKQSLGNAHIAKLNELTESEVSELTSTMVDESGLAILQRPGGHGITIVSSQMTFTFNS